MNSMTITEKIKKLLDLKKSQINARIFVSREDGITIYDTTNNQTTNSVSVLVSGMWQASEALVGLTQDDNNIMEYRLGFDTSSRGIFLYPLRLQGKRYFFGGIYQDCLNPGLLKRQLSIIKNEIINLFDSESVNSSLDVKSHKKFDGRNGFLFHDISDEEMDRLFSLGRS